MLQGAMASSCGGLDNQWTVTTERTRSDSIQQLLAQLNPLAPVDLALTNSPGSDYFDVRHPRLTPDRFTLQSKQGPIEFVLPAQVTERVSDITFIVDPEKQNEHSKRFRENEATLFRELIWQGRVSVPAGYAPFGTPPHTGRITLPAALIFQGPGNTCRDANDFVKWVLWIDGLRTAGTIRLKAP